MLFKSPHDFQQVDDFGKQLNLAQYSQKYLELRTKESFGHLVIEKDPKMPECLPFCSKIVKPGPSVLYIPFD